MGIHHMQQQHSTTLNNLTQVNDPPAPLDTSQLSVQVNDPRNHTEPHGSWLRYGDSLITLFLGLFNCLYLTQFLTDFGQILDSESYEQVCMYAHMHIYTSMQVCKYASMHIYASIHKYAT